MTDPMTTYQAAKQAKRAKQRQQWMAIAQQHDDAENQARALLQLWPQQLPKVVRALVSRETHQRWVSLRSVSYGLKFEETFEDLRTMQLIEEGMERYSTIVDATMHLLASLPDVCEVICSIIHPDDLDLDTAHQRSIEERFRWDNPDHLQAIQESIALGMMGAGGLVIKQRLKLKYQTLDHQGQTVWKAQERVYGLHVGMGELHLLTDRDMRRSYSIDAQTGAPIPLPGGVSFGDLKAYARQKQRNFPAGGAGTTRIH